MTAGGNIMVNYNDINLQRSNDASKHLKNTFDKPLVSQSHQPSAPNQYLSLSD